MPDGGKLTIEATNVFVDEEYTRAVPELIPGQYVVICVTDTGHGMPAEVLGHAFEPFFTTKDAGHGTGLGLSQVYGFVKQSGGHVKIYSELGQGTTVKMYFPRLNGAESEEIDSGSEPVPEGDRTETILVVEDDKDLRNYVAEILRNLNYRVIATPNAQGALTILLQDDKRVDLLLTDIVMPGIKERAGKRAQVMRPGLPVLYMTGYSRNAIVHQGRLDEGVEFLPNLSDRRSLRRASGLCLIAAAMSDLAMREPLHMRELQHEIERHRSLQNREPHHVEEHDRHLVHRPSGPAHSRATRMVPASA